MSNRKDSKAKKVPKEHQNLVGREYELQRAHLVEIYRTNSIRTLNDVRQGLVNELDVDMLQNFVQTSLALMSLVSVPTFRQAQRNAELLGFMKGHEVVLAPYKQPLPGSQPVLELDMDHVIETANQQLQETQ